MKKMTMAKIAARRLRSARKYSVRIRVILARFICVRFAQLASSLGDASRVRRICRSTAESSVHPQGQSIPQAAPDVNENRRGEDMRAQITSATRGGAES